MTSLDPLERVVSTLARDPNLPRIKKLLYCACYGVWEDNAERLNQVSLQEIVQGVWERSPTLEALQFQLNRVVKTLNKPVAYAHVANVVLQVLNDLYFDTYDITQPVMVNRVQFPLAIPGAPGSSANPGNPAAVANPGFNTPAPANYRDARATPQGNYEPQSSPNSGLPHGQQQGYGPDYGTNPGYQNPGYQNQGLNEAAAPTPPHGAHPQSFPSAYAAGNPGQSQQAFSNAAQGGYAQPGYPQVGHSSAEYAQAADSSTDAPATQWFVGGQEESAKTALTPAQLSAQTAVRAHVLQSLSQHREQRRMKKLLVCVCHNQWENNRSHLAALDWELLLDDARQLMPTLQGLEHVLKAIVNSLSKPLEYQQVAQLLLEIVTPLYEQERPDETQFFGVTPEPSAREGEQSSSPTHYREHSRQAAPSHAGPTYPASAAPNFRTPASQPQSPSVGLYGAQPSRRASDSFSHASGNGSLNEANDEPPTGLFAPQLPASPMDSKYPPRSLPSHGGDGSNDLTEGNAAISHVVEEAAVTAHPMGGQDGANVYKDAQDWGDGGSPALRSDGSGMTDDEEVENDEFTLRLSLMRYANPLMSKVVIFSALYRLFRFSEQDWVELRHHSLGSLIGELEERYPNLIDLEMKLCGVAEQLEVPEQAMQTVAALLKVLKPRYDSAKQAPARNMELAAASAASAPSEIRQNPLQGSAPSASAERATAIQFGPDGSVGSDELASSPASPAPASAVIAEVLPSEVVSSEALISDDLEADLALLAASLEDDGPSLPHDS